VLKKKTHAKKVTERKEKVSRQKKVQGGLGWGGIESVRAGGGAKGGKGKKGGQEPREGRGHQKKGGGSVPNEKKYV